MGRRWAGITPVLRLLGSHRGMAVAALAAGAALSALAPAAVSASQVFARRLESGGSVTGAVLTLAGLAAADRIVRAGESSVRRYLAEQVSASAVTQVLGTVAGMPYPAFDDGTWRDRLAAARDTAAFRVSEFVISSLVLAQAVLANLGVLAVLLALDVRIAGAAAVSALALLPAHLTESSTLRRLYFQRRRRYRELEHVEEVLAADRYAKEVRTLQLAPELLRRRDGELARWRAELMGALRRTTVTSVLAGAGSAAALGVGYALVADQARSSGSLAGAIGALTGFALLTGELGQLVFAYSGVARLAPYVLSLGTFLGELPSPSPDATRPASTRPAATGPRDRREVGRPVLRARAASLVYRDGSTGVAGIDLDVAEGEWVAVVGPNGAGKSSLLKLLTGLYPPTSGEVLVDGAPPSVDGSRTAVLWQDFQLFGYSVAENVAFGRLPAAGREEDPASVVARIEHELRAAGLGTLAADGGSVRLGAFSDAAHELSGGQRQRLALARTAFRDARLWLLDEPTAALDPEDAAALVSRLRARFPASSAVVVTHHLGIARSLDRIVVVDGGRIVEAGRHETLIAACGLYARMFSAQAAAFTHGDRDAPA